MASIKLQTFSEATPVALKASIDAWLATFTTADYGFIYTDSFCLLFDGANYYATVLYYDPV